MSTLYALIEENTKRVVNVTRELFKVPAGWVLLTCPDRTEPGDTYVNGSFIHNTPEPVLPSIDQVKENKQLDLNNVFDTASKNAHLMSSLGFEINADEIANRNIEGLALVMSDTETTMFCDYNNEFHTLTKQQLENLRKEIVYNSQRLYQKKWLLREQINAATTLEALNDIDIYTLLDTDDDNV